MNRRAVKIAMGLITLGIVGWDVYLWRDGVPENTISATITRWAVAHPWSMYLVIFCVVGLLWHWYRGHAAKRRGLVTNALVILAVGALGMAFVELIGFY